MLQSMLGQALDATFQYLTNYDNRQPVCLGYQIFLVPNFVYVPVNYALTCDCISAFVKNSPQD